MQKQIIAMKDWVLAFAASYCGVCLRNWTSGCILALHILSNYYSSKIPISEHTPTYCVVGTHVCEIFVCPKDCLDLQVDAFLSVGNEILMSNHPRSLSLNPFDSGVRKPFSTIARQQRQCDYSSYCMLVASC